ncbi:Neurocan core protein, partial [Dissostichus eleginoides]
KKNRDTRRGNKRVTHTQDLSLLFAAVSSLRLMRGWWQGAVALPADLEGVMMGAGGQGPQGG